MKGFVAFGTALVLWLGLVGGMVPAASAPSHQHSNNNNSRKLRNAVTVEGILEHSAAFQRFAQAEGGNRLAGAPGHQRSARYVAERARAAGYDVSLQEFDYNLPRFAADFEAPALSVVGGPEFTAGAFGGVFGGDFGSMRSSAPYAIDITAPVWAIDLALPPGPAPSTSGCEASDYAGVPAGAIIIVQIGSCGLNQKLLLADASGADAVVLINEGQSGRTSPPWSNLDLFDIQGVSATIETGTALANGVLSGSTGLTARFKIDWRPGTHTTQNVVAETPGGDEENVIVVGAHLDSVGTGPGYNDNGSGSSTILEIAEGMAKVKPRNKVRFIWFSAEEAGLLGSIAYVEGLSEHERSNIAAMLNFDMIGSPNFARFVYDGDLSDSPPLPSGAPSGSAQIEDLFVDYFAGQGLTTLPTPFDGRSDYGPFLAAGIPAGGLFTGAEGIKTDEQAAIFGGVAGRAYDPCYHLSCDSLGNINLTAVDQMSDAAAHVTISLAQSTQIINGNRGKGNFNVAGGPAR